MQTHYQVPLSVICGWKLLVAVADEEEIVDEASQPTADQRSCPVHPVVVPAPAHHCRTEGDCWVHGGSVESPPGQNVCAHDETDRYGCDCSKTSLLGINGRGIHGVHQPEGHHDLENERVPHSDA